MGENSRVVFSSFRSDGDPMLDAWRRFRDAVAPSASAARPTPGRSGVWRILATNNRELCRAAHVYPSFDAARAHVLQLRDRVDDLVVTAVAGPKPGTRGWFISHRGVVVITCGRWYGAAASSSEAAAASLEALAEAAVSTEARDVTSPGRRAAGERPVRADALVW